jgi:chemotaxis protein MotB
MPLARRRAESGMTYWPGFVDALSTLILGIIFLLTVFVVVQFYLQQEVAGKDTALNRLNAQIAELTNLLSLEKAGKSDLQSQLASLRATLANAESERDTLKAAADQSGAAVTAAEGRVGELSGQLDSQKKISTDALAQVEVLNQQIAALRRQLAAIEQALDASEKKNQESQGG